MDKKKTGKFYMILECVCVCFFSLLSKNHANYQILEVSQQVYPFKFHHQNAILSI